MSQQPEPDAFTAPFQLTKTTHRNPYPAISPENPKNNQGGTIIVISGGGRGIGLTVAKVWARAGASGIVLAGRSIDTLAKAEKEIQSINNEVKLLLVPTDISGEKDVENLFSEVQKSFGRAADVLVNNAGFLEEQKLVGEADVNEWWKGMTINVKGPFLMAHYFIKSQPSEKKTHGTIISVSSGLAGMTSPGYSSYSIAKLAEQRMMEYIDAEYPHIRAFTVAPGIVKTDMTPESFMPFAHDHAELVGMLALYLVQPRADYLKGSFININWDVEEMEAHKEEIVEKKLLKTSWLPILPVAGGKGLVT